MCSGLLSWNQTSHCVSELAAFGGPYRAFAPGPYLVERKVTPLQLLHSWLSHFPVKTTVLRLQAVGMILVFQMELNGVCNHRLVSACPPWTFRHRSRILQDIFHISVGSLPSQFYRVGGSQLTRGSHPGGRQHRQGNNGRGYPLDQLIKTASTSSPELRSSVSCHQPLSLEQRGGI